MSDLREHMIADMRSQGLAASTQEVYLQGVKGLAAYCRRSPDQLDEKDVRRYLLDLRDERGVARGTYLPHQGGIRFLFAHTLDRDWPLFLKKESARPKKRRLPYVLSDAEARAILSCAQCRLAARQAVLLWALACDDRPWGSRTPPAVIYSYAPGVAAANM